jgi:hypothetical protein
VLRLKRQIERAFSNTRCPGDEKIVDVNTDVPSEYKSMRDLYKGRDWKDVDIKTLRETGSNLCFLSSAAFRYYLPGLMMGVLEHYVEVDTLSDSLVFALTPSKSRNPGVKRHSSERLSGYTQAQGEAVQGFLRVLHDHFADDTAKGDVDEALTFWNTNYAHM